MNNPRKLQNMKSEGIAFVIIPCQKVSCFCRLAATPRVVLIRQARADLELQDDQWYTPLWVAYNWSHQPCMDALLKASHGLLDNVVTGAHWTGSPNKSIDQTGKNCPKNVRKLCFRPLWTILGTFFGHFVDIPFFWAVQRFARYNDNVSISLGVK